MTKEKIIKIVCDSYQVDPSGLVTNKRKSNKLSDCRFLCMTMLRKYKHETLSNIGSFFKRDHTTVLHAIRTVEERSSVYPEFKEFVDEVEGKIREERIRTVRIEAKMLLGI